MSPAPTSQPPAAWKLRDLVELSTRTLDPESASGESRRVRWIPNERLVRYYTTVGLLDRPAEIRGRTAFYGARHLLQLLAIKHRQGEGRSLKEIQHELAGLPDRELAAVAGLAPGWEGRVAASAAQVQEATEAPEPEAPAAPVAMDRGRFWVDTARPEEKKEEGEGGGTESRRASVLPLQDWLGLGFAPGATLLVDKIRYGTLDLAELRRAAGPLIALLNAHGRGPGSGAGRKS